jgi:hemolysin activation/secretion protein
MNLGTSPWWRLLAVTALPCALNLWADDAPPPTGAPTAQAVVPAQGRTFPIREFQVSGNTVLKPDEIERVLGFYLGDKRAVADVDAARATLEKLYRELGYRTVSVVIPRQTIQNGIVQLQVNETRIGGTRVEGGDYSALSVVTDEVPSMKAGTVPNFKELQRDLIFANRIASRRVTPELQPGKLPGTLDLTLRIDDDLPLGLTLGWNNEHARGTTEQRAFASLYYGNLFQRGHNLSLFFNTAPERVDDGRTYSVSYVARFPDTSWSLQVSDLQSNSDIVVAPGISTESDNNTVGLRLTKQLRVSSPDWYPSISFGADYKHFRTTTKITTPQGSTSLETPLTYLPFNLSLEQSLRAGSHRIESDAALIFSTTAFGSDEQRLDLSRFGARGEAVYLRASVSDAISLPRGFGINLRVLAQASDRTLLPAEKLPGGGAENVRGYFESETTGDRGIVGGLELRAPSIPDLFASASWASVITELQPYLFFDAAHLRDHGPFVDDTTPRRFTLMSTGAGVSVRAREYAWLQLVWSQVLRDVPFVTSDPNSATTSGFAEPSAEGDTRVLVRFLGSF